MKKILVILLAATTLYSCNFLDKNPDQRAEIDTQAKVRLLLVSAYADCAIAALCEMSADNMIDNNSPDETGAFFALTPLNRWYDEAFAWEPVISSIAQDSPYSIWGGCYSAIAAANQALLAIEKLEAEGIDMSAEKAEALLSRAYHHFILVNVFCQAYKDEALSKNDLGVFYMTEPETTVRPEYPRMDVTYVYENIEKDLEEALPLVSDSYYKVPKYRFNVNAAHAFAARFYLYKRDYNKVIEHASYVLGPNAESAAPLLLQMAPITDVNSLDKQLYMYIDASNPANLLIVPTSSVFSRHAMRARYQCNREPRKHTLLSPGPWWSSRLYSSWATDNAKYGSFLAKAYELFEYTDKINGYGYVHCFARPFTTNETLLCRAEAEIYLGQIDAAVEDLHAWAFCHNNTASGSNTVDSLATDTLGNQTINVDKKKVTSFYNGRDIEYCPDLSHAKDMSPSFVITDEQMPYIWCVLHFRRMETIFDGLRFFDLKRYGIEYKHAIGTDVVKTLIWNDDRRAIQLPQEVILSGVTANPREIQGDFITVTNGGATLEQPKDEFLTPFVGGSEFKIVTEKE